MKIIKPDYHHGLINLISSIAKYYHISSSANSLKLIDDYLSTDFDNLFLILVDGMGSRVIKDILGEDSFLYQHINAEITTVFPSTTTAATTSVMTSKMPIETAWIGWEQYFTEINRNVIMFLNQDFYSQEKLEPGLTNKLVPYTTIFDQLKIHNEIIFPSFAQNGVSTFEEMGERILEIALKQHRSYTYCYWDEFDSLMHKYGVDSPQAKEELLTIETTLKKLFSTLNQKQKVIVIADHGQINTTTINLAEYPQLVDCFRTLPALESRTIAFYLKPDKELLFKQLFKQYFGDSFLLMSSEEFIQEGYLGYGVTNPRTKEFLGDYIAIATDSYNLLYDKIGKTTIGQHAGLTENEMLIPVILKEEI